jgi:Family of unknown function (DUF5701)
MVAELERQVDTFLRKGYAGLAGLGEEAFLQPQVEPLVRRAEALPAGPDVGRIPCVLALAGIPPAEAISRVELRGKTGFTSMEADDLDRFTAIDAVGLPSGGVYLVTDVDPGPATRNVAPDDALETIAAAGRSPLTIDEGLAVVTHYPEVLAAKNYFSMLGSRCGDRRVTAVWVSRGRPRLGWCWAGNPHTWLGSASCAARLGP